MVWPGFKFELMLPDEQNMPHLQEREFHFLKLDLNQ